MIEEPKLPKDFGDMLRELVRQSQPVDRFSRHMLERDVNALWGWAYVRPDTVVSNRRAIV